MKFMIFINNTIFSMISLYRLKIVDYDEFIIIYTEYLMIQRLISLFKRPKEITLKK